DGTGWPPVLSNTALLALFLDGDCGGGPLPPSRSPAHGRSHRNPLGGYSPTPRGGRAYHRINPFDSPVSPPHTPGAAGRVTGRGAGRGGGGWRTPRHRASTTAFISAGHEPMAPASPAPLTPSMLAVEGTLRVSNVKDGESSARGSA